MISLDAMVRILAGRHGAALAREICLTFVDARVSRVAIHETQVASFRQIVQGLGLHATMSDQRHVPKPDIGKGGYSNRFYGSFDDGHPDIHRIIYVARAICDADAACRAEDAGEPSDIGAKLGYPLCCTAFYDSNVNLAEEKHQGDLFPLTANPGKVFAATSSLLNFAANYFDGGWCSFFPCSLLCNAALARLQHERNLVSQAAPWLAARLDNASSGAIIYSEFNGVAWIKRANVSHQEIHYPQSEVVVTLDPPLNDLFQAVAEGDRIRIMSDHGFQVYSGSLLLWEERRYGSYARVFR